MTVDDRTIRQLMSFGLTEYEARVYMTLSLKGPQKASALATASGISRPHIYSTLKDLKDKGLIDEIPKKVIEYRAVPAADAFYLMIEKRKRSISKLEEMSKDLTQRLEKKEKANEAESEKGPSKTVYIGHWNIINAITEIISKARIGCDFITSKPDDAHFIARVFEREISDVKKRGLNVRVLIPVDSDNIATLDTVAGTTTIKHIKKFEGLEDKNVSDTEISLSSLFLRVFIVDDSDVIFITSGSNDAEDYALHTKQKDIVDVAKLVFFNIWNGAQDFVSRKEEIENGFGPESVITVYGDTRVVSTFTSVLSHIKSEACVILYEHQFVYNLAMMMLKARNLIGQGVRVRVMVDINNDISTAVSAFKETGAEIRHCPGGNMVRMIMSDSDAIVYVVDENVNISDGSNLCIYTNQREALARLAARFEKEWAMSIDASDRIRQIKDTKG